MVRPQWNRSIDSLSTNNGFSVIYIYIYTHQQWEPSPYAQIIHHFFPEKTTAFLSIHQLFGPKYPQYTLESSHLPISIDAIFFGESNGTPNPSLPIMLCSPFRCIFIYYHWFIFKFSIRDFELAQRLRVHELARSLRKACARVTPFNVSIRINSTEY